MTSGEIMRELILGFSGFAMGVLLALGIKSLMAAKHGDARVGHISLAIARFSTIIVIALITQLVYDAPLIPPDWKAVMYTVGMAGIAIGYFIALVTRVAPDGDSTFRRG